MKTIIQQLADFISEIRYEDLPDEVVHESKRILLDSIGCAFAGKTVDKGRIAIELSRQREGLDEATIISTGDRVSLFGASFANGELINALDYDVCHLPPGHVSPYVISAPLALAEQLGEPGKKFENNVSRDLTSDLIDAVVNSIFSLE